ncbi:MAG: EAL domain-containing protein [Candidatus Eremiobacteraeota bacterium]|nr:EAL domain-containing protein [Candidatus Eremiobacteraeota bacterium]
MYALGLVYSIERVNDARRQAVAMQSERSAQTALRLENAFGLVAELAGAAALSVDGYPSSPETQRKLTRLAAVADPGLLSGIHAYALDDADVSDRPWYKAALAAPGKAVMTAAGASETFGPPQSPSGVVLVEIARPKLDAILASAHIGDRAWVTDAGGNVIAGAPPPSTMALDAMVSVPLGAAPWTLQFASHFPEVDSAQSLALSIDIPLTIIAWGGALLTIVGILRVRGLQMKTAQLQKSAVRDNLTGLYNRAYVLWRLKEALRAFSVSQGSPFGVLYIDLDRFAVVNDSLGHSVGDELLCAIARRLEGGLPAGVEIGRIGGDEFVAVAPPSSDHTKSESVAQLILGQMRQPFRLGERDIYISASIGIVAAAPRYGKADELLRDADTAMYAAKRAGRNRLALFDESMREQAMKRHTMESALHRAIAASQIFARYQPIVNLSSGAVAGAEALARWMDDRGKLVSPDLFIPLAEQCGAIDAIDWVVLARACSDVHALQRLVPNLTVSVNLSAGRLNQTDLVDRIRKVLDESDLTPGTMKFEVTESAIMESPEDSLLVLNELCEFGSQVVIDDFGTGHSSLSYVQRLPVAGLKIDRSFITPIAKDNQSLAIVQAIVALAKTLKIYVVAEGVESEDQAELLRQSGVDYAQGFYFAPALELRALQSFVEARKESLLLINDGDVQTA